MKKIKIPTKYATGGHLGRIYPEGEDDLSSLGGWQRHLKFDKIDAVAKSAAAEFCIGSAAPGVSKHFEMCLTYEALSVAKL